MVDKAEREILDMIQRGDISAEDGLRLMNAMANSRHSELGLQVDEDAFETHYQQDSDADAARREMNMPKEELARIKRIKRWWVLPFGIGLLFTILGAVWMYSGYVSKGFGVGFWLSWIPLILGIFLVAVSFQTSHSVWLHVRVHQKPGEKPQRIAISLPVPVSLTRWFLKTFGDRIPGVGEHAIEYAGILENLSPDEPFYIHVDEDGEEVEVFIG